VIALAGLMLTSSGAGASPSSQRPVFGASAQFGIARSAMVPGRISYKLGRVRYPTRIHPRCGSALQAYAVEGAATVTGVFTFAGGIPATIYLTPCHARPGDAMTATLTDVYGHIIFVSQPSPGNVTIKDAGVDSQATLVIKDNTTGYSVTRSVWYAY
jgi:hypothetical protein